MASKASSRSPRKTYPKLTKTWGTYAGRPARRGGKDGTTFNPLELTIKKLPAATKNRTGLLRSIYEASLIDVMTDLPILIQASIPNEIKVSLVSPIFRSNSGSIMA